MPWHRITAYYTMMVRARTLDAYGWRPPPIRTVVRFDRPNLAEEQVQAYRNATAQHGEQAGPQLEDVLFFRHNAGVKRRAAFRASAWTNC
ncbi:MAG: hypothetical protein ACRDHZ_18720 [Ktedonobacteraceae bacterium]